LSGSDDGDVILRSGGLPFHFILFFCDLSLLFAVLEAPSIKLRLIFFERLFLLVSVPSAFCLLDSGWSGGFFLYGCVPKAFRFPFSPLALFCPTVLRDLPVLKELSAMSSPSTFSPLSFMIPLAGLFFLPPCRLAFPRLFAALF